MVSTLLHLGDSCKRCGESVQTHLQNPFGVKILIHYQSSGVTREEVCNNFVDNDGNGVPRNELFERASL